MACRYLLQLHLGLLLHFPAPCQGSIHHLVMESRILTSTIFHNCLNCSLRHSIGVVLPDKKEVLSPLRIAGRDERGVGVKGVVEVILVCFMIKIQVE